MLRVKFGDPAQTWFYIDPEMSRVVAAVHRLNRVERWLYSGLHDLERHRLRPETRAQLW